MKLPWLSVIIPTYNGEYYLTSALASIVLQGNLDDVECIVVDDDSTDKTLSIVESFAEKIPITLLKKQGNKGWVASTNQALRHATGEYVCFLHQDDLWLKERLNIFRATTKKYPELDIIIAPSAFIDGSGRVVGVWRPPLSELPKKISRVEMLGKLLIQNFIAIPSPVFKRTAALECGGMDEALWYTADWDFWLKLASHFNVGYIGNETTAFRVHAQSQTLAGSGKSIDEFRHQLETVFSRYSQNFTCSIIQAAKFSITVNTILAAGFHGDYRGLFKLAVAFFRLSWNGKMIYCVNSCIFERVFVRIRAGLRRRSMIFEAK